jgi:hypothetical protein
MSLARIIALRWSRAMTGDALPNDPILRPDFSHRVVRRVHKIKRRRQLCRWALIPIVSCAFVISAILFLPAHNLVLRSILTVPPQENHSEWIASDGEVRELESNPPSFGQPLAFFFPSSSVAANIQSAEAAYWHSYDPWWNPMATLDSPGATQSQLE